VVGVRTGDDARSVTRPGPSMRVTTIEARIRDRGVSRMPQTRDRPLSTDLGSIGLICRSSRSAPRSVPARQSVSPPLPERRQPLRARDNSAQPPARDLHNTATDCRRRGLAELPATRYTATFKLSAAIAAITRIRTTLRRRSSGDDLHDLTLAAPDADRGRPRLSSADRERLGAPPPNRGGGSRSRAARGRPAPRAGR
jgi:hypothetical protein